MEQREIMKVLWVDNDPSIIEGTQLRAEQYDIDLPCFPNWEEAEKELLEHFADYQAIVLDANCEFTADSVEDNTFLSNVKDRMLEIFGDKKTKLPWYVLSAGTMDHFDEALRYVNTEDRKKHNDDWGPLLYFKDKSYDDGTTDLDVLFRNIRKTGEGSYKAKIRSIYADVFRALEDRRNHLDEEISNILVPILTSIHFPETVKTTTSYASFTQLRQVLEYLFRACNKLGLVADECIPKGKVNLQESLCYLAGQDCRWAKVRYGSQFSGDHIFPEIITTTLQQILKVANACTHTADEVPGRKDNVTEYLEAAGSTRKLQSYALELCNVIVWYGKYVAKHPSANENRKWKRSFKANTEQGFAQQPQQKTKNPANKSYQANGAQPNAKRPNPAAATYEYRIVNVECDEMGIWHYKDCLIVPKGPLKKGDKIEIFKIETNTGKSGKKYQLVARNYNKIDEPDSIFSQAIETEKKASEPQQKKEQEVDRSEYAIFPRK